MRITIGFFLAVLSQPTHSVEESKQGNFGRPRERGTKLDMKNFTSPISDANGTFGEGSSWNDRLSQPGVPDGMRRVWIRHKPNAREATINLLSSFESLGLGAATIHHAFPVSDSVAATVTEEELDLLQKDSNIESVVDDPRRHVDVMPKRKRANTRSLWEDASPEDASTGEVISCLNATLTSYDYDYQSFVELYDLTTNVYVWDMTLPIYTTNEFRSCLNPTHCYEFTYFDDDKNGFSTSSIYYMDFAVNGEVLVHKTMVDSFGHVRFGICP